MCGYPIDIGMKMTKNSAKESFSSQEYQISIYMNVSKFSTIAVFSIGILVILGWIFDIEVFKSVYTSFLPMMFNSALCFVLSGLSLLLIQTKRKKGLTRSLAYIFSSLVVLIGFLTLCEYLGGVDLRIDQVIYKHTSIENWSFIPGRMAPISALNFLLIGAALLMLNKGTRLFHNIVQLLVIIQGSITLLALIGYMYSITHLFQIASYKPIAILTTTAFILAFLAVFFAHPDRGLTSFYISNSYAGLMLRRLLKFTVLVPLLLGAVIVLGYKEGLYDVSFSFLIFVVLTIVLFSGLLWLNSYTLSKTELKQKSTEQALYESENRYKTLFEHAYDAIFIFSLNGQLLDVNEVACKQLRYSKEELLSMSLKDLESSGNFAILNRMEDLNKSGHSFFETSYLRNDGTVIYLEVSVQIMGNGGNSAVAIARDISKRKQLQEQFRQAQKMEAVGRLAGGVAHDFNNLLTVIRGYSDMLLEDLKPDDPARADIKQIKAAGDRAAGLTEQLLAFSRKQMVQPKVFDLNNLVKNVEKILCRIIGEDIEFTTILSESGVRIKAGPGQIEQVIMNLAVNARDAMPNGGKLTIETSNAFFNEEYPQDHFKISPGHYVLLSISDTGCGMDHETQSHIFEPFFTTKEKGKGTGLGLSTVYGIVKQSKGYLFVYSELEKGTTFKIYLPPVEGEIQEIRQKAAPVYSLRGSETILLVEDDDLVRNFAETMLKKNGYAVLEAKGGKQALKISEEYNGRIHCILTDVIMPQMSGNELAETLTKRYPDMQVVFISGYDENFIVHNGMLDKRVIFISKPFNAETLLKNIREVLDEPQIYDSTGL